MPMFSDEEILNATKSLNRQAATAIDGYTKDLLLQAFEQDASIISLFGTLLHWILTTNMSHTIRRILLLNRGVAIPKMDGGVRPICVSSTLLKIIGVIAMKRDGAPPSAIQMAIGVKEGHVRIAHRVREHVETHESSAVIRVDISNAFGNMPRTLIHSMLQNREETLKQYYRLVYGTDSDIAIYPGNGDKPYIHTSNVGVKQGDSTSSMSTNANQKYFHIRRIQSHCR